MSLATLGTGCVPRRMSSSSGSIVARTRAARARASVEGDAPEPEPEEPPRKLSKKRIREVFSKLVSGLHSSKKSVGFLSRSLTPFCIPEEARGLWDFTCAPCCWGSRSKDGAAELGRTLRWGGGRSWTLAYPWTGAVHESARSRTRSDSSVVDTCF